MADLRYVLAELECSACRGKWHWRLPVGELPDLDRLAAEFEVEHCLGASCGGSVTARTAALVSGDLHELVRRREAKAAGYDEFRLAEGDRVEVVAACLGVSLDKAAALEWAEREVEAERLRLGKKPEVVLGLGLTTVRPLSSVNVCVQPQVAFRPTRLEVPDDVGKYFFVKDIKVGRNSQLDSTGCVPASLFGDRRHHLLKLRMDVATISMFCTVSVTNASDKARGFTGALVGEVLDESSSSQEKVT